MGSRTARVRIEVHGVSRRLDDAVSPENEELEAEPVARTKPVQDLRDEHEGVSSVIFARFERMNEIEHRVDLHRECRISVGVRDTDLHARPSSSRLDEYEVACSVDGFRTCSFRIVRFSKERPRTRKNKS